MFINLIRGTLRPGTAACVNITVNTTNESLTYSENQSFTLNAGVLTGSTPITYQWQRKYPAGSFADISGATSASYTESSGLTVAQSGTEYRCNVSNACSSATSRVITITVLASPPPGGGL
jgi:hypothetical protein